MARTGPASPSTLRGRIPGPRKSGSRRARGALVQLTQYLERGIRAGRLRPVPNPVVAARLMIETLVFWAVHRHWDPSPQPLDPQVAQDTVVQMLVGALVLHSGGG
jgi:hypothetical protein